MATCGLGGGDGTWAGGTCAGAGALVDTSMRQPCNTNARNCAGIDSTRAALSCGHHGDHGAVLQHRAARVALVYRCPTSAKCMPTWDATLNLVTAQDRPGGNPMVVTSCPTAKLSSGFKRKACRPWGRLSRPRTSNSAASSCRSRLDLGANWIVRSREELDLRVLVAFDDVIRSDDEGGIRLQLDDEAGSGPAFTFRAGRGDLHHTVSECCHVCCDPGDGKEQQHCQPAALDQLFHVDYRRCRHCHGGTGSAYCHNGGGQSARQRGGQCYSNPKNFR